MSPSLPSSGLGVFVEREVEFSLLDLCRACGVDSAPLMLLVEEGVLTPRGDAPHQWRFEGSALRRARVALRLGRDLELSPDATALVLDLLDEIDALKARLQRSPAR